MASYGRNFDFRVPPVGGQRSGRFVLAGDDALPIGAPVIFNGESAAIGTGTQEVELAAADDAPVPGLSGILVFEYAPAAFAGDDPFLTTYSDKDTVAVGSQVQVVSGDTVKVAFTNTSDRTFLETRSYSGRVMVAGIGIATPTVEVGEFLTPGVGSDASGYWKVTTTPGDEWLIVTAVDNDRGLVEARFTF